MLLDVSTSSQCISFSVEETSQDCKGLEDHRGIAVNQEIGNDADCVAGNIVIVKPDCIFDVSPHARNSAFQFLKCLQVNG